MQPKKAMKAAVSPTFPDKSLVRLPMIPATKNMAGINTTTWIMNKTAGTESNKATKMIHLIVVRSITMGM
jgi:endonuclease V-like protein UPF0215 family